MKDLFERAKESDVTILDDPNCSIIKHKYDDRTPLHLLANSGEIKVLNHPDCSKIKDDFGSTPLHELASKEKVKPSHLKKLFPRYLRKRKGIVTKEEIDKILNTPQAIQYILEED